MNATSQPTRKGDHYFVPGDEFLLDGHTHRVIRVGDCNALAVPTSVQPVTVTDRKTGQPRTFTPTGRAIQVATATDPSIITKFAGRERQAA